MARLSRFSLLFVALFALIMAGCDSGGPPEAPKTADQAVLRVVNGMAENKPVAAWDALPESYQKDVTEIVHSAIGKVDPALYNDSVALVQRVTKVLKDKKQFIIGHPAIAQMVPDKAEFDKQYDPLVGVLENILASSFATHEKAKAVDVRDFLNTTGAKVMADLTNVAKLAPGGGEGPGEENEYVEMVNKAKQVKATLVKEEGDKATVKMEAPGEEAKEVEFVRVEGKWIPADMAKEWKTKMDEAKKEIAQMKSEDMAKTAAQVRPILGVIGGLLEGLEKANTQEEFNASLEAIMGMMMGGGGSEPSF